MKKVTLTALSLICLFVLGACTAPKKTHATEEQKRESQKLERAERAFFTRGGMFK